MEQSPMQAWGPQDAPMRPARLSVGIISAGRVGSALGVALERAGHVVVACSAISQTSLQRAERRLPDTAVLPAQQGMIIWVVSADNKVSPRVVAVERIVAQTAFLSSGVALGDRVVTDGQIRLAPGATVRIEPPRRNPTLPASEERRMNGRG